MTAHAEDETPDRREVHQHPGDRLEPDSRCRAEAGRAAAGQQHDRG
jgi:hypothetical protein